MNSPKPKVTVYIPSHNYGRFLQEAIESVLRQTMESWELLLIDDGSSDTSPDIIRLYETDPRVRTFSTGGIGLAAAANLALKHAHGDYIVRLDGDDVFADDILLVLSHHLDRHPNVALVFPDYYLIDERGHIFAQERREQLHYSNHSLDMPAHGACTMIRRSTLEALGGYREDLGAQDGFDLWSRITRGHKCTNVNLPLFFYRRHGTNLTNNTARIFSARRTIKKDASRALLANVRPIVGVIPCRRFYDIHQDLWNQRLNGTTLLGRALDNFTASDLFDRIVVTSDNPEVQETMAAYRDERLVFVKRQTEDTITSKPLAITLEKVVDSLGSDWQGLSVLSYLQTPFATTETLEEAIYTLVMNDADSSFAVNQIDRPLFRRGEHGLVPLLPQRGFSSDFDAIYAEARIALATRNQNLRTGNVFGRRSVNFVVSSDEAFFIRTQRDLDLARIMFAEEQAKRLPQPAEADSKPSRQRASDLA